MSIVYLFRRDDNAIVRLCEGINWWSDSHCAGVVRANPRSNQHAVSRDENFRRSLDLSVDDINRVIPSILKK